MEPAEPTYINQTGHICFASDQFGVFPSQEDKRHLKLSKQVRKNSYWEISFWSSPVQSLLKDHYPYQNFSKGLFIKDTITIQNLILFLCR